MVFLRGDMFYIIGGKNYAGLETSSQIGRPAVIVSNNAFNKNSDYVEIVYLTTKYKKPLLTHCEICCKQLSTAMCETIYTVHKDRLGEFIKTCTDEEIRNIDICLARSLGLNCSNVTVTESTETSRRELESAIKELQATVDQVSNERDLYRKLYKHLKGWCELCKNYFNYIMED